MGMGMGMGAEGSNPTGAGTLTVGCCCSARCIGKGTGRDLALAVPQSGTRCCHSLALLGAGGDSLAPPECGHWFMPQHHHCHQWFSPVPNTLRLARVQGQSGPLWVQVFPVSVQISPGGCKPPMWGQTLLCECRHPVSMQNPLCGVLLCGIPLCGFRPPFVASDPPQ